MRLSPVWMTHTHQHTLCHFISLRGFLLLALTNLHSLDVAFIFMPKQSTLCVCFRRDSYVFILSAILQLEAKNPICLLLIRELYMCVCVCSWHTFHPFNVWIGVTAIGMIRDQRPVIEGECGTNGAACLSDQKWKRVVQHHWSLPSKHTRIEIYIPFRHIFLFLCSPLLLQTSAHTQRQYKMCSPLIIYSNLKIMMPAYIIGC